MVKEILRNLREITAQHREEQEEAEDFELEAEKAREYGNKWEARLHLFRTSEVAQFLRGQNESSFGQLWERLQYLVYNLQTLAPRMSKYQNQPLSKVPFKYRDVDGFLGLYNVDHHLTSLTSLFQENGQWYQPFYLTATDRNPWEILDYLGPSTSLKAVRGQFLTSAQWREIHHNIPGLIEPELVTLKTIFYHYQELLKALPKAEAAVTAVAEEIGVVLKPFEPITEAEPLN